MQGYFYKSVRLLLVVFCCLWMVLEGKAQANETFPVNTYVIDMGVSPQTVANSLKPYGLVYALLQNSVPVKWVISGTKLKDGIDFTGPNGKAYRGGPFLISGEYAPIATAIINTYKLANPSVVVDQMTASFVAPVYTTLKAAPRWTLDQQNGSIAQGYLVNAGIPATSYNYKDPQLLAGCDDIFVMPHADPKWSTHSNLLAWNQTYRGAIWAACHAVSALENMFDPANPTQQTNFLSETTATATGSGPYANNNSGKGNSLILWGAHADGSTPPPYKYAYQNDPVMQFLGRLDAATQNGSEQIYLPLLKGANPTWRTGANGAKIAVYDDSQSNVPGISPGPATVVAYGAAFADANRGKVMYEAGHSHNKGSAEDVAAQRAFMNFSLWASQDKALSVTVGGISSPMTVNTAYPLTTNVTANIPSGPYTYAWTASCPGTFSPSATAPNPTFTPSASAANCVISVKVTDACGRTSSESTPVVVQLGPQPPVCVNDNIVVEAQCAESVSIVPLTNDSDPINSALSFMLLNGNTPVSSVTTADGTFTKTNASTVVFTPIDNFVGTATVSYRLTNALGLSSDCSISVTFGTPDANGCLPGQAPGIAGTDSTLAVTLATSISNPANALSDPDYDAADNTTYAVIDNNSDVLTLDLGSIKSNTLGTPTDSVRVYFATDNDGNSTTIQIEFSTDDVTYTTAGTASTDLLDGTEIAFVVPTGGVRYIRLKRTAGEKLRIDAALYEFYSCLSVLPIATSDVISLVEDESKTFDPTDNDNLFGTFASIRVITQPTNGKAVVNVDGTITYQPNTNFAGTDSFTYKVCNTDGYCGTGTISATITDDGCIPDVVGGIPQYRPIDLTSPVTTTLTSSTVGVTVKDSWIKQDGVDANKNYGNATTLEVGKKPAKARRGLFQFNWTTAVIPAGAIIQSAQLSVFKKGGDGETISTSINEVTEAWTEGAGGSNDVTWNNRTTATPWGTAGGVFNPTPVATISVLKPNVYYNWTLTNLVQKWNDTPASNFGVLMKQTIETTLDKRHQYSSDEDKAAQRPKLIVTYATRLNCQDVPNRKPLAAFDYETTDSQTPKTIDVLANDSDPDNNLNNASLAIVGSVTGGTAVIQSGQILFTPTPSFNGEASFKYLVSDNGSPALTDTAFVYVTVTNAPPKAINDVATVLSNTNSINDGHTINVSTNDVHLDGPNPLTTTVSVPPTNGTATVSGGNIIYTPNANFTGTDVLTYQICEPVNAASCNPTPVCATATLTITVQNRPPVPTPDITTANPCQPVTIKVLSNDSDPENGSLTVTIIAPFPTKGTYSVQGGDIIYTANPGETGSDVINYQICDDGVTPLCAASTATVNINNPPVNPNAPIAVNDAESLYQGQTVYIAALNNDSEPDGQPLVISSVSGVTNGTATIVGNLIEFVPNPGFFGQVTFQYTVCDVFVSPVPPGCLDITPKCATANITVDVLRQPIPVAFPDNTTTTVNVPITINVTSNDDFGLDGPSTINAITITGPTSNGGTVTVVNGGTGTQADDQIFYTPANNFTGTETFKYTICDANGDCSEALVTVIVSGVPSIKLIKSITSITDNAPAGLGAGDVINYTFTVTNTGTTALTAVGVTDAKVLNINCLATSLAPGVSTTCTGTYVITQADVNAGGVQNTATATGTPPSGPNVTDVSDAGTYGSTTPVANPDVTESPKLDGTTDADPTNDPTVLLLTPAPSIGVAKAVSSVVDNNNGTFTVTYLIKVKNVGNLPLNNIQVRDTLSNTFPSPATTNVTALSSPTFTVNSGTYTGFPSNSNLLPPTGNSLAVGDSALISLTVIVTPNASSGVYLNSAYGSGTASNGTIVNDKSQTGNNVDPDFDLDPGNNFDPTPVSFTAKPPVASDDINNTLVNVPVSGNVLTNDDDPQKLPLTVNTAIPAICPPQHGAVVMQANGNYTYTPQTGFVGTDRFCYIVCNSLGLCDTATVTIDVMPQLQVNSVVANDDATQTQVGTPVKIIVKANDFDPQGDVLGSVVQLTNPLHGGVAYNPLDSSFTYTPTGSYVGKDSFKYLLCDVKGACDTAIVTIDVLPVIVGNDPPVAIDDANITPINTPVSGTVASNDSDVNNDPLTFTKLSNPAHGSVIFGSDGKYTYTPSLNYTGPDRFTYTVCDNGTPNLCDTATVYLTVLPIVKIDLSVDVTVSNQQPGLNGTVTLTVSVKNDGPSDATGVELKDVIPAGMSFETYATAFGSYLPGVWTIGNIPAGQTVTLSLVVKVNQTGIQYYTAQVSKADQPDVDSTPDNNIETEDDFDRTCLSVPVPICPGQIFELQIPAGFTNIQWYKNDQPIENANGLTYQVTSAGVYRFTASNATCPTEGCCPYIFYEGDCCPTKPICVPFTIKKIKK